MVKQALRYRGLDRHNREEGGQAARDDSEQPPPPISLWRGVRFDGLPREDRALEARDPAVANGEEAVGVAAGEDGAAPRRVACLRQPPRRMRRNEVHPGVELEDLLVDAVHSVDAARSHVLRDANPRREVAQVLEARPDRLRQVRVAYPGVHQSRCLTQLLATVPQVLVGAVVHTQTRDVHAPRLVQDDLVPPVLVACRAKDARNVLEERVEARAGRVKHEVYALESLPEERALRLGRPDVGLVHLNAHHVRLEVADVVHLPLQVLHPTLERYLLLGLEGLGAAADHPVVLRAEAEGPLSRRLRGEVPNVALPRPVRREEGVPTPPR
mmetsp:Transcript_2391/g.6743  ORF Transcript_2391/g.6743 Transcript_2391/m.6743 type:complete len:327 (+) Transcript_2391:118-1098(+)